jgi:hypothetical protein
MTVPPTLRVLRVTGFVDFYRRGVLSIVVGWPDATTREHRFEFATREEAEAALAKVAQLVEDMRRLPAPNEEGKR